MLLVSAIMLSTASFAWFSMNTDVKVEGIEFVAYSDSLFLEISKDNQTFSPADITETRDTIAKAYLRPVAFGTIEDMGGAYIIEAEEITDADARFERAEDPDDQVYYYERIEKADTNDTKFAGGYDYICVNSELRPASSTEGLYILGDDEGVTFTIVTDYEAEDDVTYYERVGNNYIVVEDLEDGDSVYGYYTAEIGDGCGEDATYDSDYVYYDLDDNTGNFYVAGGLDLGSYVEGLYTFTTCDKVDIDDVVAEEIYWLRSQIIDDDPEADYIAFQAAEEYDGDKVLPKDGYWYRGYSESLDTNFDNDDEDDGETGRINGVINGTHPSTDSDYYLYTTYYLRMAQASNLASNLRINSVEVIGSELENSLSDAVRVMLVVTSSVQDEVVRITYNNRTGEFMRETSDGRDHDDTTLFFEQFLGDRNEVVTVEVYMYYDGTDAKVNTNYTLDFSGHTVNLEFGIDTPDYLK